MSKKKSHIDELTPDIMQKYLRGRLSPDEQYQVERYLLDHPFEAEAMQGFEGVEAIDLADDIGQLEEKLTTRSKEVKVIPLWQRYWKVAAVITVLVVSTFLILDLEQEQLPPVQNELALHNTEDVGNTNTEKSERNVVAQQAEIPDLEEEDDSRGAGTITSATVPRIEDSSTSEASAPVRQITQAKATSQQKEMFAESVVAEHMNNDLEDTHTYRVGEPDYDDKSGELSYQSVEPIADEPVAAMLRSSMDSAAISTRVVVGRITSQADDSAVAGANIVIKGTTMGTTTDQEGNYEIAIPEEEEISLVYSYIGLESQEVQVSDQQVINVVMMDNTAALSEVVITAKGVESEKKVLGSATSKKKSVRRQDAQPVIGFSAYYDYLRDSLRYPQQAIEHKISGKVFLEITIGKEGQLSGVIVRKGIGYGCDEEAVRLVREGPVWQQQVRKGEPVVTHINISIEFTK